MEWKQRLGGNMVNKGGSKYKRGEKREVLDVFKSVQAEEEDIKNDKAPKVMQKTVQVSQQFCKRNFFFGRTVADRVLLYFKMKLFLTIKRSEFKTIVFWVLNTFKKREKIR